MFKQLQTLLRKGDTISVTIALETEAAGETPAALRLNVYPRLFTLEGPQSEARTALNQPLSILGTAEELDTGLAETLTTYTASANELRHTLDDARETHKAAAEKVKAKSGSAKPAVTPSKQADPADKPSPKPKSPEPKAPAEPAMPSLL